VKSYSARTITADSGYNSENKGVRGLTVSSILGVMNQQQIGPPIREAVVARLRVGAIPGVKAVKHHA